MALNKAYLNCDRTIKGDECYTPFYAVEPLLEFIPKNKIIWCPFDEEWSAFVQLFKERGYKVIRSSLGDGKDFFKYEPNQYYDVIISNPPFSKKDLILKRIYELNKPFALLLPVNSIQGKKRYNIFKNNIQLLVFDARIDYHTAGNMKKYTTGNSFGSAYFCKDILPSKLEMRKLIKYDRPLK